MARTKVASGRLIVLEGGEGAGKSTHAAFVAQWLRAQGRDVLETREPGGSPVAEAIRGVVLGDWPEGVSATTELLLMFAARSAHLDHTIRPALAQGRDVVCDRFLDASYAYQGAGRGLSPRYIDQLAAMVLQRLRPRLVLLLDIDPEAGMQRTRKRGQGNRFDHEQMAFQRRVRKAYLQRAQQNPGRFVVIPAGGALAAVQAQLRQALEQHL